MSEIHKVIERLFLRAMFFTLEAQNLMTSEEKVLSENRAVEWNRQFKVWINEQYKKYGTEQGACAGGREVFKPH